MKKLMRHLLAGVVFGLGLLITPVLAGYVAPFTGPAGSNPIGFPANLGDMNKVINGINNNAFTGTASPSGVIAAVQTTSLKFALTGTTSTTALQIVNGAVWTTVTGTNTCNSTTATICLGIFDNLGTLRWFYAN